MHSFEIRDDYIWMYNYIILVLFAYVRIRTKNTKKNLSLSKSKYMVYFFICIHQKTSPQGKRENHLRDQRIIILESKKDSSSKGSEIKGSSS